MSKIKVEWATERNYTAVIDAEELREAVQGDDNAGEVYDVLNKLAAGFGLEASEEAILRDALEEYPDLLPETEDTEDYLSGDAQVSHVEAAG